MHTDSGSPSGTPQAQFHILQIDANGGGVHLCHGVGCQRGSTWHRLDSTWETCGQNPELSAEGNRDALQPSLGHRYCF